MKLKDKKENDLNRQLKEMEIRKKALKKIIVELNKNINNTKKL